MASEKRESIWTWNFTVLCIMNFIAYLGQTSINSLMQIHMDNMNATATVTGIVIGLASGSALLMRPIAGSVIDGARKKRLLLICELLFTIAVFGYAVSTTVWLTVVFRVVYGIGMGFFGALDLTMATDALPKSRIASGIGFFSLVAVAGQALGPMICISAAEKHGVKFAFILAGIFLTAGLLIGLLLKYPREKDRRIEISVKGAFAKEALIPGVLMFLLISAGSSITSFIVLFAGEKGVPGVSGFFGVNAVVLLLIRPFIGRISDKYGVVKIIYPTLAIFAVMLLLMPQMRSRAMLYVMAALYSLGYGTTYPSLQALCMKLTPEDKRGAGTNTFYLFFDLGLFVGPIVAGGLKDIAGFDVMYVCMIAYLAVSAVILLIRLKNHPENRSV